MNINALSDKANKIRSLKLSGLSCDIYNNIHTSNVSEDWRPLEKYSVKVVDKRNRKINIDLF